MLTKEELASYYIFDDEDEELDEYDYQMMRAMQESEETGIPFDHIMGEILAGIH